jgi:hypothetical protein
MKKLFLHLSALVVALGPLFLFGPAVVSAEEERFVSFCGSDDTPDGSKVTVIGDSLTVGATSALKDKLEGVKIYAQNSKQFSGTVAGNPTGMQVVNDSATDLRDFVVVALGTNGTIPDGDVQKMVNKLGKDRTIVFVRNYKLKQPHYYAKNNQQFNEAAKTNDNVFVSNWDYFANLKPDTYINNSDGLGVHLTADGTKLFVDTIYSILKSSIKSSGGGSGGGSGDGKDYSGKDIFNGAHTKALEANRPFYEKSANKVGIPWEMIAVIHYRESRFERSNPGNGQGVYQFYDKRGGPYPTGAISDDEFQRQTDLAAEFIKGKAGSKASQLKEGDEAAIKYTFFAYNGIADAYKRQAKNLGFSDAEANYGEGSPYVMNRFDAKRDPTIEPVKSNGTWGQIKTDGGSIEYPANDDHGAFTIYAAIAGSNSCAGGGGSINDVAIMLSWPDRSHGPDDPNSAYRSALLEVDGVGTRKEGDSCSIVGKSCDAFVATVMRHSKADENFPCCGAANQLSYLSRHSDLYDTIPNTGHTSDLRPGDIRVRSSHIEMIIQLTDGSWKIASASHCDRTGDHGINFYPDSTYTVFRKK